AYRARLRAREIQPRRAGLARGRADDAAVDELAACGTDDLRDLAGGGRRNGVRVHVETLEPPNRTRDVERRVGRANGQQQVALGELPRRAAILEPCGLGALPGPGASPFRGPEHSQAPTAQDRPD